MKIPFKIWDLPTRLFHWLLVLLVILQFATAEWGLLSMEWHFRFGYCLLTLILFRIFWGFFGSDNARFTNFITSPRRVLQHIPTLLKRNSNAYAGHNPLGGWSVLLFILLLLFQIVSGLFSSDDIYLFGPLAQYVTDDVIDTMTRLHKQCKNILLLLIFIHMLAIAWYTFYKKEPLVKAMISGKKNLLSSSPNLSFAPISRAWFLFFLSMAITLIILWWSGEVF